MTEKLGYTPTPEAIFYYIYAIFHSPTYPGETHLICFDKM
ncbi:MAG: type ISP restriction/modification enzyme [Nostoc sp.]